MLRGIGFLVLWMACAVGKQPQRSPVEAAAAAQPSEAPAPVEQAAPVPLTPVLPDKPLPVVPIIFPKDLPFSDTRKELTVAYRAAHTGGGGLEIEPTGIVLHWTGGATMESAWATFAPTTLSGRADVAAGGSLNVSAHFLIDRDGSIYRLMPDTWMARHCIGLNHTSIGVENVGDGGTWPLTPAQVAANAELIRYLVTKHPITWLIGHHEYRKMEGTPYFVETDPTYRTVKVDPGDAFMTEVRAAVADLGLQGPP